VLNPSILKRERPPRHLRSINLVTGLKGLRSAPLALAPAGAGSFFDPRRTLAKPRIAVSITSQLL
jgi:hypothetical protein